MPEIRLSDYVQRFANTLSQMSRVFGGISSDLSEKARVSAVNDNLLMFERSFQDYMDNAPKISYEEQMEDSEEAQLVPKTFGEAQFYTIDQAYTQFVSDQAEYIKNNVTHKQARQELLWHLQQKAIQERGNLLRLWDQAADAHAKTGLAKLYDATMKANIPWEEKVARIQNRVVEMVRTGRLSEDQGQIIVQEATEAAQYSYARGGALEAIREANDLDAGEKWIRENTPFYDQNPDAREELIGDVRREWDAIAKREDAELDRIYADMHINADTIDLIDDALMTLEQTEFHDGDEKYKWETRFRQKREYVLSLMDIPDLAKWISAAQDDFADRLRARLAMGISQGMPISELYRLVDDAYYTSLVNPDTGEEVQAPRITGQHVKEFYGMLDAGVDDRLRDGLEYIDEMLDGDQEFEAVNAFRKWYAGSQTATPDDILNAAKNIVDPIRQRNLAEWASRTAQELLGDKAVLTAAEKLMRDISEGRLQGLTDLRAEDLAVLNSVMLAIAQHDYRARGISTVSTDKENDFNAGYGAPILVGADGQVYVFKLEDKQLILYRLARHKDGSRAWERVRTAQELEEQAEAEEEKKRREPYEAEIIAAAEKTPAEKAEEVAEAVSEIPEFDSGWGATLQKTAEEYAKVEAESEERIRRFTWEEPGGGYDLSKYERISAREWYRKSDWRRVPPNVARKLEELVSE